MWRNSTHNVGIIICNKQCVPSTHKWPPHAPRTVVTSTIDLVEFIDWPALHNKNSAVLSWRSVSPIARLSRSAIRRYTTMLRHDDSRSDGTWSSPHKSISNRISASTQLFSRFVTEAAAASSCLDSALELDDCHCDCCDMVNRAERKWKGFSRQK